MAERLGVSQQTIQAYEPGKRRIQVAALPKLARLLSTALEELFGQQQETTARKRVPAPKWQQQLEAIDQLPKSQQKFVAQMLDALSAQATTKARSEGREVLQLAEKTTPARGRCLAAGLPVPMTFVSPDAKPDAASFAPINYGRKE